MGNPKQPLTDAELDALPKIRPEHAARYLQDGSTAQDIRVLAQKGICPFCSAEKRHLYSARYVYRVNPGLLRAYKRGELGMMGDRQVPASPNKQMQKTGAGRAQSK